MMEDPIDSSAYVDGFVRVVRPMLADLNYGAKRNVIRLDLLQDIRDRASRALEMLGEPEYRETSAAELHRKAQAVALDSEVQMDAIRRGQI